MKKYKANDFMEMIKDWQADHAPEYDDLEIEEPAFDEELGWVAYAKDEKETYSLTDDGTGNIRINYSGNR